MKYKRIARSRRGLGKWHTLWLGDDHLLAVESTGYSEEYTRYYLKDIQAVVTRRSAWGMVLNSISGTAVLVALIAGIVAYGANSGLGPGSITAGIFAGFFLILLFWNLFRGPTCRCHIRVPLGIEELPALDRVKRVKKVLDRLRPLVDQLQGGISRNEIVALTRAAKDVPPAASPATQVAKPHSFAPQMNSGDVASSYHGGIHRSAFLLLIAVGGLCVLQVFHNGKALVSLVIVLAFAFLLLAVIALIKQNNNRVSPLAGKMVWGGLASIWIGAMTGYFFMIFLSLEKFKGGISRQNEILDLYAAIKPADHPTFAFFLFAYAAIAAGIGITGLVSTGSRRP